MLLSPAEVLLPDSGLEFRVAAEARTASAGLPTEVVPGSQLQAATVAAIKLEDESAVSPPSVKQELLDDTLQPACQEHLQPQPPLQHQDRSQQLAEVQQTEQQAGQPPLLQPSQQQHEAFVL
jgi:hypothetical protein